MLTKKILGILASLLVVTASTFACELCNNPTATITTEGNVEEILPIAPASTLANCPQCKKVHVEQTNPDQVPTEVESSHVEGQQVA
jgi:hypothetical protein